MRFGINYTPILLEQMYGQFNHYVIKSGNRLIPWWQTVIYTIYYTF